MSLWQDVSLKGLYMSQDGRGCPNPYMMKERCGRVLWFFFYRVFYRLVPRYFNGWHRFWLRRFGASVGKGCIIYPSAEIQFPWRLMLKDYCVIGWNVRIYNLGMVTIGKHAVLSQYVYLCAGTHDYLNPQMPLLRPPIEIGDGCWIATEVFVGPNVKIGENSVVGARSVVMSNLSSDKVCYGNPCCEVKARIMHKNESSNSE